MILRNKIDSTNINLENYQEFIEINKKLDIELLKEKVLNNLEESLNRSLNIANKQINKNKIIINQSLSKICLDEDYKKTINNGLLIYHKFRAKNAFGGKVISNRFFRLNENKKEVIESCLIE